MINRYGFTLSKLELCVIRDGCLALLENLKKIRGGHTRHTLFVRRGYPIFKVSLSSILSSAGQFEPATLSSRLQNMSKGSVL